MSVLLDRIMEGSMVLLIIGIFLAFARAVRGPRFTDRIVAINMIGTMTTAIICILSEYLKESMLVDVALVIICHVVTLHHKGRELYLKRKEQEAEKQ